MRIIFIVDETIFFLPTWLDNVLTKLKKEEIVCITPLVTRKKPTFYSHLIKNIYRVSPLQIFKLGVVGLTNIFKRSSIEKVARKHQLRIIRTDNVNNSKYQRLLKELKPDLIVSSCSQIFDENLIKIPKIACINRHSAILPSYGGVFPIFWAMLNNEKKTGVTIHHLIKQIDKGSPIFQTSFPITKNDTLFSLYKKAYDKSVDATINALDIIKKRKNPVLVKASTESYYSFPKDSDWDKFFTRGHKLI